MKDQQVDIERFDINQTYDNRFLQLIREEHISRYVLAQKFLQETKRTCPTIIDAACGYGYGYNYLNSAGQYIGIDISKVAVKSAKENYPGATYVEGDLLGEGALQRYSPIGAIVSFETVEHLEDPSVFLRNCFRELAPTKGYLIFSAPTVLSRDIDPYHVHDKSASQWRNLATEIGFKIIQETPLGFTVDFKTFSSSTPDNPEQTKKVIRFLFKHPRYLAQRIWEWGIKRSFVWESTVYVCCTQ